MVEHCAICGCELHRTKGTYARPSVEGRSHATKHHFVAERFFGRSANRRGKLRERIFPTCPWGVEGQTEVFCYECHEELLHNPVLLPADVACLAELVQLRGYFEEHKSADRSRLGGRVQLLHEAIARGLAAVLNDERTRTVR